uniref:Replication stress response regulator SDE2 n=1 Tax=Panagrolaimus sp. JU765 TaxID=591449 RepID=A0AC34RN00_9BILA
MDLSVKPGLHYAGDKKFMEDLRKVDPDSYWITVGNHPVKSVEELHSDDFFQLQFRLLGGKGGFGSLLKSFRIHKSSNQLMARDLTGRRLADVREEERLRRWIAKKAERDAKKKKQEEEKLLKLKSGSRVKHEFKDKKYMRQRDLILENTEDAIEAGLNAETQQSSSPDSGKGSSSAPEVEESDSDIDLTGEVPLLGKNRKRKVIITESEPVKEKKQKLDKGKTKSEVKSPKVQIVLASEKTIPTSSTSTQKEKSESKTKENKVFEEVNLNDFYDAKLLEQLGLDHLKHALESRGLKCSGSLTERAERLFSVKGLTPDKYPKKIRAVKK